MEKTQKQINLAVNGEILDEFKVFCAARGLALGYATTAAIRYLMLLSPDERENALVNANSPTYVEDSEQPAKPGVKADRK